MTKLPRLCLLAAMLAGLSAMPLAATAAATAASAPAVAPSAVSPAKPEKRPPTPEEGRDSATAPSDLMPESRVTPQLNLTLTPSGTNKPTYVRPSKGKAAPSGGIDDSAARCKAMSDEKARQDCLGKLR
ncbi:MAG: hypothetical protein M9915_18000 [Rhizobacter sp.]|nr:hypothetical protein [Burkholderiaceae bacterium]MCO5125617.1 hypothetical protein [Rhizobacter sp.]